MKKLFLITITLFLTASLLSAEGGADFSGDVETLWAFAAPWTDSDKSAGRYLIGNTSLTGKLDAYYDNSSALAEGSVFYDAVSNKVDYSLNELWLDYTDSFWGVRIGRQKTAWGKADGIDITNIICPSDMSNFSAMISDDSKLAVDAARLSLNGNQFTADFYWIPFFTPAALPADKLASLSLEKPELAVWNGEYGLKVSGYFSAFDISLYAFYGWDDMPFLDYDLAGQDITASGKYKNLLMFGTDAALPIKEVVLRAEAAFFPQRNFQRKAENIINEKMEAMMKAAAIGNEPEETDFTEKRNQLSALAGLDWMPEGWTITSQYFCDLVFGDLEPLERSDAYTHGATLSLSKNLLNETLELSLSGVVNFNDFDTLINPNISYSISDQISAKIGAYIFNAGPDKDGQFGTYKDLSAFYISGKYSF